MTEPTKILHPLRAVKSARTTTTMLTFGSVPGQMLPAVSVSVPTIIHTLECGHEAEPLLRGCRAGKIPKKRRCKLCPPRTCARYGDAHKLKCVSFNEETGEGVWACICGFERTRTAKFMCEVKGAE